MKKDLKKKLTTVPDSPGVYLFKDSKERVIYVGKAKSLKKRLKSYFQAYDSVDIKTTSMVKTATDFSFIVTDNEVEALALEANFIKQYRPRFNVILRDDKNYPYLRVTVHEEWPCIEIVRKFERDNAVYIGPYVSSKSMRESLDFIKKIFPIRTCKYRLENITRSCIQYEMGYCGAPCVGLVNKKDYRAVVNEVIEFLKGRKQNLLNRLTRKMQSFSDKLMFEEAARTRDKIRAIQKAWETQKVVAPELGDMDVVGYYQSDSEGMFNVFFIRNGILIGAKDLYMKKVHGLSYKKLVHSFIEQFYNKEILPPSEIIVREKPQHLSPLKKWLKVRRGNRVNILVPSDGKEEDILKMAEENAMTSLNQKKGLSYGDVLNELTERLKLPGIPQSIGAFDISTIFGSESAGGFIYWKGGRFVKDFYRHVRIKTVTGIDDYAMMKEAIVRILDNLKSNLPDLILIDGGKGQLEVALRAWGQVLKFHNGKIKENEISKRSASFIKFQDLTPMFVAVAKNPDRAFIPDRDKPVNLEDGSPSSLLLKKIRDEVHRFAITYHRKLRDKRLMKSPLERIKGISSKRRLELLRHFNSLEAIRNARIEEIRDIEIADLLGRDPVQAHSQLMRTNIKHKVGSSTFA